VPLPIAHACVGAAAVAAIAPYDSPKHWWASLGIGALLAVSPDLDFLLVFGLGMGGLHRTFTHSLFFGCVVGLVIVAVLGFSRLRLAIALTAAFISHSLLDYATTKFGGGVELLWPFSTEPLRLGIVSFSELAHFQIGEMLKWSAVEALVFVPILSVLLLARIYLSRFDPLHTVPGAEPPDARLD
jgi:membrane-bound metal-dependent hydrolase YbcI (DUF457 family)